MINDTLIEKLFLSLEAKTPSLYEVSLHIFECFQHLDDNSKYHLTYHLYLFNCAVLISTSFVKYIFAKALISELVIMLAFLPTI